MTTILESLGLKRREKSAERQTGLREMVVASVDGDDVNLDRLDELLRSEGKDPAWFDGEVAREIERRTHRETLKGEADFLKRDAAFKIRNEKVRAKIAEMQAELNRLARENAEEFSTFTSERERIDRARTWLTMNLPHDVAAEVASIRAEMKPHTDRRKQLVEWCRTSSDPAIAGAHASAARFPGTDPYSVTQRTKAEAAIAAYTANRERAEKELSEIAGKLQDAERRIAALIAGGTK